MNRVDELNKLLDRLMETEQEPLEKVARELVQRVSDLPLSQFMLLLQVIQQVNERYVVNLKKKI